MYIYDIIVFYYEDTIFSEESDLDITLMYSRRQNG